MCFGLLGNYYIRLEGIGIRICCFGPDEKNLRPVRADPATNPAPMSLVGKTGKRKITECRGGYTCQYCSAVIWRQ